MDVWREHEYERHFPMRDLQEYVTHLEHLVESQRQITRENEQAVTRLNRSVIWLMGCQILLLMCMVVNLIVAFKK